MDGDASTLSDGEEVADATVALPERSERSSKTVLPDSLSDASESMLGQNDSVGVQYQPASLRLEVFNPSLSPTSFGYSGLSTESGPSSSDHVQTMPMSPEDSFATHSRCEDCKKYFFHLVIHCSNTESDIELAKELREKLSKITVSFGGVPVQLTIGILPCISSETMVGALDTLVDHTSSTLFLILRTENYVNDETAMKIEENLRRCLTNISIVFVNYPNSQALPSMKISQSKFRSIDYYAGHFLDQMQTIIMETPVSEHADHDRKRRQCVQSKLTRSTSCHTGISEPHSASFHRTNSLPNGPKKKLYKKQKPKTVDASSLWSDAEKKNRGWTLGPCEETLAKADMDSNVSTNESEYLSTNESESISTHESDLESFSSEARASVSNPRPRQHQPVGTDIGPIQSNVQHLAPPPHRRGNQSSSSSNLESTDFNVISSSGSSSAYSGTEKTNRNSDDNSKHKTYGRKSEIKSLPERFYFSNTISHSNRKEYGSDSSSGVSDSLRLNRPNIKEKVPAINIEDSLSGSNSIMTRPDPEHPRSGSSEDRLGREETNRPNPAYTKPVGCVAPFRNTNTSLPTSGTLDDETLPKSITGAVSTDSSISGPETHPLYSSSQADDAERQRNPSPHVVNADDSLAANSVSVQGNQPGLDSVVENIVHEETISFSQTTASLSDHGASVAFTDLFDAGSYEMSSFSASATTTSAPMNPDGNLQHHAASGDDLREEPADEHPSFSSRDSQDGGSRRPGTLWRRLARRITKAFSCASSRTSNDN